MPTNGAHSGGEAREPRDDRRGADADWWDRWANRWGTVRANRRRHRLAARKDRARERERRDKDRDRRLRRRLRRRRMVQKLRRSRRRPVRVDGVNVFGSLYTTASVILFMLVPSVAVGIGAYLFGVQKHHPDLSIAVTAGGGVSLIISGSTFTVLLLKQRRGSGAVRAPLPAEESDDDPSNPAGQDLGEPA